MSETLLTQLQDPEARRAVIEVVLTLFEHWQLHEINQAELLGVSNISDLQQDILPSDNSNVFQRIGHLLAIDRALVKYFSYRLKTRNTWILQPHDKLDSEMPLTIMLEQGLEGIKRVSHILESQLAR